MYGKDNPGFPSEFLKSIKKDRLNETGFNIRQKVVVSSYQPKRNTNTTPKTSSGFKAGDKIMHKVFGKGMIVKVEDSKITVAFSKEYGIKTLMDDHPSITRI